MNAPAKQGSVGSDWHKAGHRGGEVATWGTGRNGAVILIHGRGASARGMKPLADELQRSDLLWCAPQALHGSWYPQRFMAPVEANEPALSSALAWLTELEDHLETEGFAAERTVLLGFSQGACLALEHAVRRPRRRAGVVALAGGLIGPPGTEWPAEASQEGTPFLLACGDADGHIPAARVEESAAVLEARGGEVEMHLYPGFGHGILPDELVRTRSLLERTLAP